VATANLAEAEGRALRRSAVRTSVVVAGVLASLAMLLAGFGLVLASLYWALSAWSAPSPFGVHPAWAYLACAGVCGLAGTGLAWITARTAK
jgi:hypothetical protein